MKQSDLSQTLSSSNTVTNYAQATITAVPDLPDPPAWFLPIQTDITTAQNHCQSWIDTICPAVTASVPNAVINFNTVFQSNSAQMLSVLQAIQNQAGSIPTEAQRSAVSNMLKSLTAASNEQYTSVQNLKSQVDSYANEVLTDGAALAKDLNTAAAQVSGGAAAVGTVTGIIGENFLDSQALGPCNVIVNIDMNISIAVSQTGADTNLITTIYAQIILQNLVNNIHLAQNDVQNLVDAWGILQRKFSSVLTDLKDASDDQYAASFEQMDLEVAQTQWQQLADFARTLTN